jgi:AraC-like DNA-binding protein
MIMLAPRVDLPDNIQSKQWGDSDGATAHVERVLMIAEGQPPESSDGEVATSWQRSANAHHLDPASSEPPRILTSSELKDLREPLANLIIHAVQNGTSLWAMFEPNPKIFRNKHRGDFAASLVPAGTSQIWPALITPPEATSGAWRSLETAGLHTRPRHDVIGNLRPPASAPPARGGLPPGALRRVKEYIDSNLEASIDLAALADTAGLSMFHFARAFKQSEGITPHGYLLERRVARAQELLITSNLSLSEIAHASGFSDQSHLARHFRSRVGVSPSMFRWSRR